MAPISRDGNSEATTSRNTSTATLPSTPISASPPLPSPPPPKSSSSSPLRTPNVRIPIIKKEFHIPKKFHSMTAGAGAGLVSSIVTCPLDVIKTSLQAQHLARDAKDYEGVRLTVLRIWRQSGFRGFYRGLGPTVGGYLPTWGIYFTVYDMVKDGLGTWQQSGGHAATPTALLHIVAAMTAGATGTILTNPLWVVKTRFMAQAVLPPSEARYRHTLAAFTSIYRTEGFRAFYKGLLPSLMGVSHVAVQFPLYEKAKSWAADDGNHASLPPSTILVCSAFSKMVASLITYPHEVLRTRLQIRRGHSSTPSQNPKIPTPTGSSNAPPKLFPSGPSPLYSPLVAGSFPPFPPPDQNSNGNGNGTGRGYQIRKGGIVDTFLQIKRQDGWRGFYRGLSINLVRTVPNSAVTMLTYELIMRRLS